MSLQDLCIIGTQFYHESQVMLFFFPQMWIYELFIAKNVNIKYLPVTFFFLLEVNKWTVDCSYHFILIPWWTYKLQKMANERAQCCWLPNTEEPQKPRNRAIKHNAVTALWGKEMYFRLVVLSRLLHVTSKKELLRGWSGSWRTEGMITLCIPAAVFNSLIYMLKYHRIPGHLLRSPGGFCRSLSSVLADLKAPN